MSAPTPEYRAARDRLAGRGSSALMFTVAGTPAPQGSKKHVGHGIMVESSKKVKPWREAVKHAALDAVAGREGTGCPFEVLGGPVTVTVTFLFARPKGHYGTGRNARVLREAAPAFPAVKPDIDKVLRSTLDAIGEAGLWLDDAQAVCILARKLYADPEAGVLPGAEITIGAA